MTNQEIIDALKEIKSKQAQIERENLARDEADALICQEFNMYECNSRRNILASNHTRIVSEILLEIEQLKQQINESIQ